MCKLRFPTTLWRHGDNKRRARTWTVPESSRTALHADFKFCFRVYLSACSLLCASTSHLTCPFISKYMPLFLSLLSHTRFYSSRTLYLYLRSYFTHSRLSSLQNALPVSHHASGQSHSSCLTVDGSPAPVIMCRSPTGRAGPSDRRGPQTGGALTPRLHTTASHPTQARPESFIGLSVRCSPSTVCVVH